MATRDDALDAMRQVMRRKSTNSLEVQTPARHVYRSRESGKPVSLVGHALFQMGQPMPDWKRNSDLIGTFRYDGNLSVAAKALLREVQQLERAGVSWSVIVDRMDEKYGS